MSINLFPGLYGCFQPTLRLEIITRTVRRIMEQHPAWLSYNARGATYVRWRRYTSEPFAFPPFPSAKGRYYMRALASMLLSSTESVSQRSKLPASLTCKMKLRCPDTLVTAMLDHLKEIPGAAVVDLKVIQDEQSKVQNWNPELRSDALTLGSCATSPENRQLFMLLDEILTHKGRKI